ncbi:NADPH-dependent FMN reductase [Thermoactinomyces sp. CICC 23799]|uniref:NADPH-dependent FMN reductase n=1 Tax=Thermoactinomyces sp. CICC 23799 TaxID=2767429 RepID=UPI0018DB2CCD|nr:NADPH-dependent FMN reductase [Thermoactinomyces sp. CICC 23799]MBH8599983.1 NADPH-dependent FMN reductase [Thermoactinomyces sp. CICC 23799]
MPDVLILSGSPSRTSRLNGILEHARPLLQERGLNVGGIHVSDLPAEALITADFEHPAIQEANRQVENADAVLIASPVYKASYTGILKTYLDLLPQKGLHGKIILLVFIGGTINHLLAIDYALKPVLSVLGARHILGGVYVIDSQVQRDRRGQLVLEEEVKQRLNDALRELIEEVLWHSGKKNRLLPGVNRRAAGN